MGKLVMTINDFDSETATAAFPVADLTEANITAQLALANSFRTAVNQIQRGLETSYQYVARVSPQAVGRSTDPEAQREEKALVRYHDAITLARASLTVPCVDMSLQNTNHPGYFFLRGAPDNHADWTSFVAGFEVYVVGPGGNACIVDEVIHVGRNL